jgi:serine/threonine-protein kinase
MDATRWQKLQDLYLAALELEGEERDAFLEAGTLEADVRDEVREMLAVTTPGRALRVERKLVTDGETSAWRTDPLEGARVGRYELLERIGRGGMGDVYRAAWRDGDIRHEVAIKVLRTSALTDESRARFRGEQAILARLSHPAIVGLTDAGVTPEGRPYFVMPIVHGTPITQWCEERRLSVAARLDLVCRVCEAVHHAHTNLVVHRDLKPSNILVTDEGDVRLLDFGVAKLMDPDVDALPLTETGRVPMTPEYAAPEQVRGHPTSTRTDVYALGVLLYETLTGARPHRITPGGRIEIERAISKASTPRLATWITAEIAARRSTSRRELARMLGGDLQTIVMKALHEEPERRYGSAAALAEDLVRWRRSLPIQARPDTWTYRARTFVRRNRAGTFAAAAVALALVASGLVFVTQSRRTAAERDRLEGVVTALAEVFGAVNPMTTPGVDTLDVATFIARSEGRILAAVADEPLLAAELGATFGALHAAREEWAAADTLLRLTYERRRAAAGPLAPETATALHEYARLRASLAAADAESLMRESLAIQRALGPDPTPDLAHVLFDLAGIVPGWTERRALLAEAIEVGSIALAGDPLFTAQAQNALAAACFSRDSLEAAAEHFDIALDALRSVLPDDHPHVLTVMQNLATSLSASGRPALAESLFTVLVAREEERMGDETARVGLQLNNLALVQSARGRHEEARATLEEALSIQRAAHGAVHPRVANTCYNLARLHLIRGEVTEAARWLDATLAACAPDDIDRRSAYARSGALIDLAAGRVTSARDSLSTWLSGVDVGNETKMTVGFRFALARALLASERPKAARAEFERVRDYYSVRGAHREEMLAAAEGGIGLSLAAEGRHEEAMPLVRRALEVYVPFGLALPDHVSALRDYAARHDGVASP